MSALRSINVNAHNVLRIDQIVQAISDCTRLLAFAVQAETESVGEITAHRRRLAIHTGASLTTATRRRVQSVASGSTGIATSPDRVISRPNALAQVLKT